jgi:hypothetical protein
LNNRTIEPLGLAINQTEATDQIIFIGDRQNEQRPSTSASSSRIGIRDRKMLPPHPSQFQAKDAEFGEALPALQTGKRRKTAAAAAVKKPGACVCVWCAAARVMVA